MNRSEAVPCQHDDTDADNELDQRFFAPNKPHSDADDDQRDDDLRDNAPVGLGRPQITDGRCGHCTQLVPSRTRLATRPRSIAHHSRGRLRYVAVANSSAMNPMACE